MLLEASLNLERTNNIPIFNASDFIIIQFMNHTYFTGIYAKLGNVPYENSCDLAMIELLHP